MKLRAMILLALTTLSLGLVLVVAPAGPAWACSCALSPDQADQRADLIVVGTVTEVTKGAVRVAVESVPKGGIGEGSTVRLRVGRDEASCGYGFRTGNRYRVNSLDGATGLCAGIRPLPATTGTTTAAATDTTKASVHWLPAVGAVLTVLAAGLVAVVLRRRRTQ